jgi:hypothetical protein
MTIPKEKIVPASREPEKADYWLARGRSSHTMPIPHHPEIGNGKESLSPQRGGEEKESSPSATFRGGRRLRAPKISGASVV